MSCDVNFMRLLDIGLARRGVRGYVRGDFSFAKYQDHTRARAKVSSETRSYSRQEDPPVLLHLAPPLRPALMMLMRHLSGKAELQVSLY